MCALVRARVDVDRAVGIDGPCAAGERPLEHRLDVVDGEAEMSVPGIRAALVGGDPLDILVIEELEDSRAWQVDERRPDPDAGVADVPRDVRTLEHGLPACLDAEEALPERERGVDVRDGHPHVVDAPLEHGGGTLAKLTRRPGVCTLAAWYRFQ
jgi:hypothetical protein